MHTASMVEICTANDRTGRAVHGFGAGLALFIRRHQRLNRQLFSLLYVSLQSKTTKHFQAADPRQVQLTSKGAEGCAVSNLRCNVVAHSLIVVMRRPSFACCWCGAVHHSVPS